MRILALECASVSASAALVDSDVLLGETFTNVRLTHSQTLLPQTAELLKNTQTDMESIDLFAVTTGPGSFTGVRIGVAALKGMADAAKKPCMGISALEAAAYPFRSFDGLVCAAMDARCNQVYTALFQNGIRKTEDLAISISALCEHLRQEGLPVLVTGDGALKVQEALPDTALEVTLAGPMQRLARASSVAYLAQEKIANGQQTVLPAVLQPVYLRLPQAQRELNSKNKGNNT